MKPKEIKEAMRKAGILNLHSGTKWATHYDPRAATYKPEVNARHGNMGPRPSNETTMKKWRRCAIFVAKEDGTTSLNGTCDCHHGEWIAEPSPWLLALIELLDNLSRITCPRCGTDNEPSPSELAECDNCGVVIGKGL